MNSHKMSGGELSPREASNFRFGESRWAEGVYHFEGHSRGESRELLSCELSQASSHLRGFQHHHEESTEKQGSGDDDGCEGMLATVLGPILEDCEEPIVGSASGCAAINGGGEDWVGNQMDFDGDGGANAAC